MSFIDFINKLERKFAWSLIGVLLALIFGAIAIYTVFIEDKRPRLKYNVLASTSVLDVKEELANLSVLFDGIDIRKQGLSLRVINVMVKNDSSKDILKAYYDENAPLGLNITTGKVIKSELLDASNEYLRNNLVLNLKNNRTLLFSEVIIETNESFTIKLLILHPKNEVPTITHTGKIAGIKSIPIQEFYKDRGEESFFKRIFKGNFWIHLIRLFIYIFALALLLVCVFVPIAYVSEKYEIRKRIRIVNEFKNLQRFNLNESDELIFNTYLIGDMLFLKRTQRLLYNPLNLKKVFYGPSIKKNKDELSDLPRFYGGGHGRYDRVIYDRFINDARDKGLIKKTKSGVIVDKHLKDTLAYFIEFISNK